MASKFAVGEIAIVLSDLPGRPSQTECEIKKILTLGMYLIDVPAVRSSARDGFWRSRESRLRKLPPPETPSTWSECLWQPQTNSCESPT